MRFGLVSLKPDQQPSTDGMTAAAAAAAADALIGCTVASGAGASSSAPIIASTCTPASSSSTADTMPSWEPELSSLLARLPFRPEVARRLLDRYTCLSVDARDSPQSWLQHSVRGLLLMLEQQQEDRLSDGNVIECFAGDLVLLGFNRQAADKLAHLFADRETPQQTVHGLLQNALVAPLGDAVIAALQDAADCAWTVPLPGPGMFNSKIQWARISSSSGQPAIKELIAQAKQVVGDSTELMFHGCTGSSAYHLAKHGVKMTQGVAGLDFNSQGSFYLTTSFELAHERALSRYHTDTEPIVAVLVYGVAPSMLDHKGKTFPLVEGAPSDLWKQVVTAFRRGGERHEDWPAHIGEDDEYLQGYTYLRGPILQNPRQISSARLTWASAWTHAVAMQSPSSAEVPLELYDQLCIRNQVLARELQLVGVIVMPCEDGETDKDPPALMRSAVELRESMFGQASSVAASAMASAPPLTSSPPNVQPVSTLTQQASTVV